jgi:hypothetical protein
LRVPLAYLRELGVMPAPSLAAGPVEELLADLRTYLARERGLVAGTIRNYERAARVFLEDRVERVGGLELQRLAAGDVTAFLARECPRRTVSGAMDLAANLRALLRYLHVAGLIDAPLVWAVPKVADLRGRSLPKGFEPGGEQIGRRDLGVWVERHEVPSEPANDPEPLTEPVRVDPCRLFGPRERELGRDPALP